MRAVTKHTADLRAAEYLAYLRGFASTSQADPEAVRAVWSGLLPDRTLVPTPTGRHALWIFLDLAGLQPGDEVIVAGYNFYVVVRLLIQRGLVPVFADVEPDTLCMDPAVLDGLLTPRTRMVLVTHIFGHPADMAVLAPWCRGHGLLLFEDCAHAVGTIAGSSAGSTAGGRQAGLFGDGALFSFGVEKLVNSFGGGLLALRPDLAERTLPPADAVPWTTSILDHLVRFVYSVATTPTAYRLGLNPSARALRRISPRSEKAVHDFFHPSKDDPAYRFRSESRPPFKPFMTKMHAGQLRRLDENIALRRSRIARMREGLSKIPGVRACEMDRHGRANGSYFAVRVPDPRRLYERLADAGIATHPREFLDCASLPQFAEYAADCPVAREAAAHVLRLPSYPSLSDDDADRVVACISRLQTAQHADG